jgi:hypothetical protein
MKDVFPSAKPSLYEEIQKYYPSPLLGTTRYITEFDRIKSIIEGFLPSQNWRLIRRRNRKLQLLVPGSRFRKRHVQLSVLNTPWNPRYGSHIHVLSHDNHPPDKPFRAFYPITVCTSITELLYQFR